MFYRLFYDIMLAEAEVLGLGYSSSTDSNPELPRPRRTLPRQVAEQSAVLEGRLAALKEARASPEAAVELVRGSLATVRASFLPCSSALRGATFKRYVLSHSVVRCATAVSAGRHLRLAVDRDGPQSGLLGVVPTEESES